LTAGRQDGPVPRSAQVLLLILAGLGLATAIGFLADPLAVLGAVREAGAFSVVFGAAALTAFLAHRRDLPAPLLVALGFVTAALLLAGALLSVSLLRGWAPLARAARLLLLARPRSRRLRRLCVRIRRTERRIAGVLPRDPGAAARVIAFLAASHLCVLVRPAVFFAAGCGFVPSAGDVALLFVAGQVLPGVQVTPGALGTFDGGPLALGVLIGIGAPAMTAYLLSVRLGDAAVTGLAALVTGMEGRAILARRAAPRPPKVVPGAPQRGRA
jgi:hypothetical protein